MPHKVGPQQSGPLSFNDHWGTLVPQMPQEPILRGIRNFLPFEETVLPFAQGLYTHLFT